MKDLYKRLGVEPTTADAEIRRAVANVDAMTRAAVEHILLVSRRRIVYDRNHRVLTTIGQLRGRLALGLRPFWSHGHHQDFAQPFVAPQRTDPMSAMNGAGASRRHRRMSTGLLWSLLIAVVIVTVLWIWVYRR